MKEADEVKRLVAELNAAIVTARNVGLMTHLEVISGFTVQYIEVRMSLPV